MPSSPIIDQYNHEPLSPICHIPQLELKIYYELTEGKDNVPQGTMQHRLTPPENWVYCHSEKKIESCRGFVSLHLKEQDGNIYHYVSEEQIL